MIEIEWKPRAYEDVENILMVTSDNYSLALTSPTLKSCLEYTRAGVNNLTSTTTRLYGYRKESSGDIRKFDIRIIRIVYGINKTGNIYDRLLEYLLKIKNKPFCVVWGGIPMTKHYKILADLSYILTEFEKKLKFNKITLNSFSRFEFDNVIRTEDFFKKKNNDPRGFKSLLSQAKFNINIKDKLEEIDEVNQYTFSDELEKTIKLSNKKMSKIKSESVSEKLSKSLSSRHK